MESRPALVLAALGILLLAVAPTGAGGAGPKRQADALRRQQDGYGARSHSALLSLYSLDSRLTQARSRLAELHARADSVGREQARVGHEISVAQSVLRVSRRQLGDRLRTLYEEGEPDAIAVLLGAASLDEAVTRLDGLERSARLSRQAIGDSHAARERLARLREELAGRAAELARLSDRAAATAASLERARAERVSYLATLARQRRLNARQIARLDVSARKVVERAQAIQAQEAPQEAAPAAGPVAAPDGSRTLTVSATGYSLPGTTATGIPVGPGVVAVDPAVIPLGTRLTIPGYGEGVAADTGSAVQGATIDLWFPTLALAQAWGRRAVTITLH